MDHPQHGDVTTLLRDLEGGDDCAERRLFDLAYREIRELAVRLMNNERAGHTLQPTALANEAALRLLGGSEIRQGRGRRWFFWIMARAMRQVLVDYARGRGAKRRGGDRQRQPLDINVGQLVGDVDVVALDDALLRLEAFNKRQADVVVLRFFGGYEMKEIAGQLEVSLSTVESDWRVARAWLKKTLE